MYDLTYMWDLKNRNKNKKQQQGLPYWRSG